MNPFERGIVDVTGYFDERPYLESQMEAEEIENFSYIGTTYNRAFHVQYRPILSSAMIKGSCRVGMYSLLSCG